MTERKDPGDALNYCLVQIEHYDYERYVTTLFAPRNKREFLYVLYAFNLELAQIDDKVKEPLMGLIRLQWWRDAITQLYKGNVLQHEILKALSVCIAETGWQEAQLQELVSSYEEEFHDRTPPLQKKWQIEERKAAALMDMACGVLKQPASKEMQETIGACFTMLSYAATQKDNEILLAEMDQRLQQIPVKIVKKTNPFLVYFIAKKKLKLLQNKKNSEAMQKDFLLSLTILMNKIFAV